MGLGHSPRIVTNGLVGYWDAGNRKSYPGSGSTWFDLSGYGHHGTLTNGAVYNSAVGGSISFDGVDDYVTVTETSALKPNVITVDITFKVSSNVNTSYGGNSGGGQYLVFRQNSRSGNFEGYQMTYGEPTGSFGSAATLSDGVQYYVGFSGSADTVIGNICNFTAVFDTTTIFVYDRGKLVNSGAKGSGIDYNSNHTLKFGRSVPTGASWDSALNGNIYQVKIYNRALSESEVAQNFNALRGRFGL